MFVLSEKASVANHFLAEMRNPEIQKDRMRFRVNLLRLGEILAYEISKAMNYEPSVIPTPLGKVDSSLLSQQPVIISVLRASLPFYQGFLNFFDQAESGFIGAFREEKEGSEIQINLGYLASPSLSGKEIIIADPMLATGKSFLASVEKLKQHGIPKVLHIAAAFAAPEGIAFLEKHLDIPFQLWLGTVDQKLNHLSYIVPGLGDAGDLAFGPKL